VLPLLVRAYKTDKNPNIPLYVTGALWNLAFNSECKAAMLKEPGLEDLIKELKASTRPDVAKNASGVWFHLHGHPHPVHDEKTDSKDKDDKKENNSSKNWDVMMSYNWASQPVMILLARKLQASGVRVWLDIDQMTGSTLEAMAEAVEGSKMVIVGVSKKYKESPNCRTEAQYAFQLGKHIVPIMMHSAYKPDGWLGALLGAQLWFDCTSDTKMEESFVNLFREVKKYADMPNLVAPATPASPTLTYGHGTVIPASAIPSSSSSSGADSASNPALKWNVEEVCGWLGNNGLSVFVKTIRKHEMDGKAVVTLASMMKNATDLKVLDKELGIGRFVDQLKFCAAIKTLL